MSTTSFDFIPNIDFKKLSTIIEENSLYEDSFKNSRFFSLISILKKQNTLRPLSPFIANTFYIEKISVVIAKRNNSIVGISLFEHYLKDKTINAKFLNDKFTLNKKKYNYNVLGFLGMYVKPEFRELGIASKMASFFEKKLASSISFDDNIIYMISSKGDSTKILRKNVDIFAISRNDGNISVWKDEAKDYIKFKSLFTRKEKIQQIQGI